MTFPVPLTFKLPEGWHAASPTAAGLPESTFVAVHPSSANGFLANLTLTEQDRSDAAPLPQLADESLRRLSSVASTVSLRQRKEVGSPHAPGLTQVVDLTTEAGDLVQCQLLISLVDSHNPGRHVIIEIALTATRTQLPDLIGDFERFAATVRVPD